VEAAFASFDGLVTGQRKTYSAWSREFQFAAAKPVRGGTAVLGLAVTPDASPRLLEPKNEKLVRAPEGQVAARLAGRCGRRGPRAAEGRLRAILTRRLERTPCPFVGLGQWRKTHVKRS
jgi:hypothetical protein